MMLTIGDELIVVPEKPAAGGRMIARHEGLVVLVAGAIPGERARVRIERVGKGVAYGRVAEVLDPDPDRRPAIDPLCGGNLYAHVAYARQLALKADIIRDALVRIGHLDAPATLDVAASPERGYRMRARLHVERGFIGFYREGSREMCDAGVTGQLLPETTAALERLAARLHAARIARPLDIELAENVAGDQRALHLQIDPGAPRLPLGRLSDLEGVSGLSVSAGERSPSVVVFGTPYITETIGFPLPTGDGTESRLSLRHNVRAFFQANRYLLSDLVGFVVSLMNGVDAIDLYAGVGLFGLALAAAGCDRIVAVEGDRFSAADLESNAETFRSRVTVHREPVESFLALRPPAPSTLVVDPPRTGMSRAALDGIAALGAARIIYVSCDIATLARDLGVLVRAGYTLGGLRGFDLFPNTPHVETVAMLDRGRFEEDP